jgi:EmrB/QacA subfamily drug resistance transporter
MQAVTQTTRTLGGLAYKWTVMIVVIFGLFMVVLDSTIVNIAIPRLQTDFGAPLASVQWVSTGYTLAQAVATPLTPFLSERLGLKRLYLLALALFTLGSALCGLSWSLPVLIFFRILQGVGGAPLLPMSITLLYREFPLQERGMATGILGIPILLAPALGPTVGGYIVTSVGWPLIFYLNVPIGIVGFVMGYFLLREYRPGGTSHFDFAGFVFSAIGLATVLYGLSDVGTDGWGSTTVLLFLAGGLLSLALFVVTELMTASLGGEPLLDMHLFANGTFTIGNMANILVTIALYGGLFLAPVYLQNLRGQTAYEAGVILLPQAFASMVAVVVGGQLVDRIGVKAVVIPGLFILGFALWGFSSVTLQTPFSQYQLLLILRGFGLGLSAQPLTVALLSDIKPKDLSQANSLNAVIRAVATSFGVAVIASLVQTQTSFHYAHLAEQVTATSPTGLLINQLQAAFAPHAASSQAATAAAIQTIINQLMGQANMLAMDDAFFFTLAITVAAMVLVLLIPIHPQPKGKAKPALTE